MIAFVKALVATVLGFFRGSPWKELTYGYDSVGIVLPKGSPFDGKPVLVKTHIGVVEAWWDHGRLYQTQEGTEADGFCWVCYDDAFQLELDDVQWWMPLPLVLAANAEPSNFGNNEKHCSQCDRPVIDAAEITNGKCRGCAGETEVEYINHYVCCGEKWQDQWSSMCNDRCPSCNAEIEPYYSENADEEGADGFSREKALHAALASMNQFECDRCGKILNANNAVQDGEKLICPDCQKRKAIDSAVHSTYH